MRRNRAYLFLSLLIGAVLLGAYSNCSQPHFAEESEGGSGTIVGNPMVTNKLLATMCSVVSRCHTQLTMEQCRAGILQTTGLGPRFGLPTSNGAYSTLISGEENGSIGSDAASLASCVSEMENLTCGDPNVQSAYDPAAPQPFAGVPNMIPSTTNSCSSTLITNKLLWTWVSGDNQSNQKGIYGTQGVASSANVPGARTNTSMGQGPSGEVYVFGGTGYDSTGNPSNSYYLNDLWRWDGTNWTWISGRNLSSTAGTYGARGTAAATNQPGSREYGLLLVAANGDIWLFGGYGNANTISLKELGDLWKLNAATGQWSWISGPNVGDQAGVYGTKGIPSTTNYPGGREGATGWIDASGNIWIFGGYGYASTAGQRGTNNDLWMFNPQTSEWTWVSGSNIVNSLGSYGTQGVETSTNSPRARSAHSSWRDAAGNFWVFAGYTSANGTDAAMNDLWKWDGTNWTWVSGSATPQAAGNYGTLKTPATSNSPGARYGQATWLDSSGTLWVFGGYGHDSTGTLDNLNDMWKFDGSTWTWMSGTNVVNEPITYGALGVTVETNNPGARETQAAWVDSSGTFWLFGGISRSPSRQFHNDLWSFQP